MLYKPYFFKNMDFICSYKMNLKKKFKKQKHNDELVLWKIKCKCHYIFNSRSKNYYFLKNFVFKKLKIKKK